MLCFREVSLGIVRLFFFFFLCLLPDELFLCSRVSARISVQSERKRIGGAWNSCTLFMVDRYSALWIKWHFEAVWTNFNSFRGTFEGRERAISTGNKALRCQEVMWCDVTVFEGWEETAGLCSWSEFVHQVFMEFKAKEKEGRLGTFPGTLLNSPSTSCSSTNKGSSDHLSRAPLTRPPETSWLQQLLTQIFSSAVQRSLLLLLLLLMQSR